MIKIIRESKLVLANFRRALVDCHCYTTQFIGQITRTFQRYLSAHKDNIPHLSQLMRQRQQSPLFDNTCNSACQQRKKSHRRHQQLVLLQQLRSNLLVDAEMYQRGLQRRPACQKRVTSDLHPAWRWFKNHRNSTRKVAPQVRRLKVMRKSLIQALFPIFVAKSGTDNISASHI